MTRQGRVAPQLATGIEGALQVGNRHAVQPAGDCGLTGVADGRDELRFAGERRRFVPAFLQILRDDGGDAGGVIAPARVSRLLEDLTDTAARQPGDEHDEQDGGARPRDQKTLPQLL